jgi:hypothetical protein
MWQRTIEAVFPAFRVGGVTGMAIFTVWGKGLTGGVQRNTWLKTHLILTSALEWITFEGITVPKATDAGSGW